MCPKIGILLLDKRDKTCFQDQISTILEVEFINSRLFWIQIKPNQILKQKSFQTQF